METSPWMCEDGAVITATHKCLNKQLKWWRLSVQMSTGAVTAARKRNGMGKKKSNSASSYKDEWCMQQMEGVLRPVAALHLSVCKIDGQPLLTSVVTTELKAVLPLRERSSFFLSLTWRDCVIYAI